MNWFTKLFGWLMPTPEKPQATHDMPTPALAVGETERHDVNLVGGKNPWYPNAKIVTPGMTTRGDYPGGWPCGAVVHFTAGHDNAKGTIQYGRTQGHAYFCIGGDGSIYQAHPANKWGHHAGSSSWPGLGSGLSSRLVGIEVCAAGKLSRSPSGKWKSWFGKEYADSDVRYSGGKDNIKPGTYHKYTAAQEQALIELLLWLKRQAPDVFQIKYVLGHDEVAPNRKDDPGAALSMTMPEFRKLLQAKYSELG